jgi:phosphatidylglycerophosphate synthase
MSVPPERPRGFGAALQTLSSKQKTAKGAPAYSRFVNRKLGRVLAAACYVAGLTPNQVTLISAAFSAVAIVLLAVAEPAVWLAVAVTLCLVLGYAFDSADGQLARLRGGGSWAGEWLDHMVDCVKLPALHAAVLISWYRFFDLDGAGYLLIPLAFLVVSATLFFAMILTDQLRRLSRTVTGAAPAEPARASTVRSLLVIPTDYGLLCLAFLLLAAEQVFVLGYTLLLAGNLLFLLAAVAKWFREVGGLDPRAAAVAGQLSVPRGK